MVIRLATIDDIPSIASVHLKSWKDTYKDIVSEQVYRSRTFEGQQEKWLSRLNNSSDEVVLVYELDNGRVVGFASYNVDNSSSNRVGSLNTIYIEPSFKNREIGRELVKEVATRLLAIKISTLKVTVLDKNPSKYFYEHLGATKISEIETKVWGDHLVQTTYQWDDISRLI